MNDFFTQISTRQEQIQIEIAKLELEKRNWHKAYAILSAHRNLLLASDKVEPRTSQKFMALGLIADAIKRNKRRHVVGIGPQELERSFALDLPQLPIGTLRAYLSRFKNEGRLSYSEKTGKWNIASDE